MMLRTGLRAVLLPCFTMGLLALTLAACGGGGGSLKLPPLTAADDHSDTSVDATRVSGVGGVVRGSIDYGGDVDWFRFEGRAGVTYAIRFDQINPAPEPQDELSFTLLGPATNEELPNSADTELTGVVTFDNENRFVMTPSIRATYYIRITGADPFQDRNNYRWIIASSEDGESVYTHRLQRDREIAEFDADGNIILPLHLIDFPLPGRDDPQPVLALFFRFGDPDVQVDPAFGMGQDIPTITLTGGMDPEDPAVHIHLGFPEVVDTQPDPFINNFSFDPNRNTQLGEADDHNIFFEIPLDEPITELPRDVWHALSGHPTYIDIHASTDFDAVPAPMTSTPPNGGLSFFESEFRLTGSQVVPSTGVSTYDCTLLYLADLKTFQWDHNRFEYGGVYLDDVRLDAVPETTLLRENPPADLVGSPINIRLGFPGNNGPIVIPLGNVVPGQIDAAASFVRDTNGDVKNRQRTLTDAQVGTLNSITYATRQTQTQVDITGANRQVTYLGWYIQIDSGVSPVRYDAALYRDRFLRGFEVSTSNPAPATFPASSARVAPATGVEHLGEVTFVTDYADGGRVLVSVDGTPLSHLTAAFTGDVPLCGEGDPGETVRVLYNPGTYTYTAEAEDGTRWEGTVDVASAGSCVTVALLESEAR